MRGPFLQFIDKESAINDYSDVDVVFGLRSFSRHQYSSKPASKLVNSWIAEVPFIGGYDSAYTDVGEPGWSYLRADTAEALKQALTRLRQDTRLRSQLTEAGRVARAPYLHESVAARWIALLRETTSGRFDRGGNAKHV